MELQSYKENILKNILDGKIGNIKKVILCLNEESFREELDKYNFQGGLLIEKNKNMELYGEIVFNLSTTIKATPPASDYSICIICIKNAISISPITLIGLLAREITHVLDIIKREKENIEVDTLSFAAKRLMESALRFIEEVKTNGSDYEILEKVNIEETKINNNNLCISIYTDGDFHLSDKSNNPIKNSLPYKYLIKINSKADAEKFAEMFYCNDFGISNPDILKALSYTIEDVKNALLEILNNPDNNIDEDELIFSNGNWHIQIHKDLKIFSLEDFK